MVFFINFLNLITLSNELFWKQFPLKSIFGCAPTIIHHIPISIQANSNNFKFNLSNYSESLDKMHMEVE